MIAYIKTFAIEFEDEELDPIKRGKVVALPANRAAFDADTIAKGKEIFERAKCWECHGKQGRGDGQKAFDREGRLGFPDPHPQRHPSMEDQGRRPKSRTSTCVSPPASAAHPCLPSSRP